MDLNELRAVSRAVLSDELKEQQQPDSKEQSKSEPNSKKQQDEDGSRSVSRRLRVRPMFS